MIVLLWRLFARWVIGIKPGIPRAARCIVSDCHQPKFPLCVRGCCRKCCTTGYHSYPSFMQPCDCEKRLTHDEVALLARYREGNTSRIEALQ